MGGLVFSMKGEDVAQALVSFAREYGITHVVVGRPGKRKFKRLFKMTLHERLLEALPDVDLVVV
jgi:two-component system sensor histidine kinase KdpD